MLQAESNPNSKPPFQVASTIQKGVKTLNQRTKKAIGKRVKVLMVESEGWMKSGMELHLAEDQAMDLIKRFKAKVIR